ncbi:thrombospondin type 3 repeat-containing protein [Nitrosopumilus ureiphilus]|uniref:Thrombospondin n=1 Tax=Nitrosopumilus ureiphilus TaxID=1470067 RepID=A0A7D5M6J0_9ARCH|nr:thrombospondin type 3 repeat-containing protein [Nitrosopumilus ureiphilus]QLH07191.1 thrombospondin [Nitrosopumilus ureiphilus]
MATYFINKKMRLLLVLLGISLSVSFLTWSEIVSFADSDKDGVMDSIDNCPVNSNLEQTDFDFDKLGDECDTDDDNDGVSDLLDQFDTDPLDWADFDFDGLGSFKDTDDDNDGILDDEDTIPITISEKLTRQYMTEIESCFVDDGTIRLLCYGNFFDSLVDRDANNDDPLELALSLSKIGVIDDCHFISHVIGHAIFDKTSKISQNFDFNGSLCRGGYYHGVMGAFFHNLKDKNEPIPDNLTLICNDLIGTSNYLDCMHGVGHGLVNYYPVDLELAIDQCHQMSYFQYYACASGAMMEYTDNRLTEFGETKENLSNMCLESILNNFDFQMCSRNIGISLAFHNNHDFEKSSKSCQMIENEQSRDLCLVQLKEEISKYNMDKQIVIPEKDQEKFQPQWIKQGDKKWIVDFISLAIISDFEYLEDTKTMTFSFDRPEVIGIYVWDELLSEKFVVTINGIEENVIIQHDGLEPITTIRLSPTTSGTALISPLP